MISGKTEMLKLKQSHKQFVPNSFLVLLWFALLSSAQKAREELEHFVEQNDWRREGQHDLPLAPCQRLNTKHSLRKTREKKSQKTAVPSVVAQESSHSRSLLIHSAFSYREEGNVKDAKVQDEAQAAGHDQPLVTPGRKRKHLAGKVSQKTRERERSAYALVLGDAIQCIEHLDSYENGQRDGGRNVVLVQIARVSRAGDAASALVVRDLSRR